jgi:hypothetical protein
MNRSQSLAQRREELVERSARQRRALVATAEPVVRRAAAVDRVVALVRRYPIVSSLVVGAVALYGPRRVLQLGTRALTLYALLRR